MWESNPQANGFEPFRFTKFPSTGFVIFFYGEWYVSFYAYVLLTVYSFFAPLVYAVAYRGRWKSRTPTLEDTHGFKPL